MTVTRSRSPSLSELPGRFPTEPDEFKIPRKAVGSGPKPAPNPVSPEDMQRQRLNADQQMRRQVLQPMGTSRGSGPADKNGGPPSAAPSSAAYSPQGGPGNPGNRKPAQRRPAPDDVIPKENWALEPQQYEALRKNPNDPQVLFHIAFYGPGLQALPSALNPQDRVPQRELSRFSAKTYPPGTAQAQPFLPNNGHPVLRNARSWQAPQQAVPYAHGPVSNARAQSSNEPPPLPPKEPLASKVPPPRPPKEPFASKVPPPLPPRNPVK